MGRRRRHFRRAGRAGSIAAAVLVACASVALAWTIGTTNPGNAITAASLGSAGTPTTTRTPTTGATCTSIVVSWAAAANADRYRVEADAAGSWTTLAASHATTSFTDTTGYTNRAITYRITPLTSSSANWSGPSTTVEIACGIGDIDDLAVTNPCSSSQLTWSFPPGATNVDIERSVNGGSSWTTVASNQTGTSYKDTTVLSDGVTAQYRVRGGSGTTNGNYSNVASVVDWTAFRIDSIAIANSGTLGTLNPGDTITVTFTKPALDTSVTKTTIRTVATGGSRGLWLPASSASAANTDIASVAASNNFYGTTAGYSGTTAWNGTDTTWTWTSTSSGSTMGGTLSGTAALGTSTSRVKCAADSTTITATTPAATLSGRW